MHYVFSDDDFDPVTETTLAAAAAEDAVTTPVPGSGAGRQGSGQGRRQPPPKDRVVIVDVGNDGETVVAAHSLSKEWQVVGVGISSAPQWMAGNSEDVPGGGVGSGGSGGGGSGGGGGGGGGGGSGGGGGGGAVAGQGGLMLTVEGTERIGLQGLKKTESLYELAEVFSERCVCAASTLDVTLADCCTGWRSLGALSIMAKRVLPVLESNIQSRCFSLFIWPGFSPPTLNTNCFLSLQGDSTRVIRYSNIANALIPASRH